MRPAAALLLLAGCTPAVTGDAPGAIVSNPRCVNACQSVIVTQPVDSIGVTVEEKTTRLEGEAEPVAASPSPDPTP